jgi:hypothetical protein
LNLNRFIVVAACGLILSACGTRSSSDVTPTAGAAPVATKASVMTDPASVMLTDKDITDRKYHSLGDIKVTVSKNTIFDSDPTPAKVDEALRKKAAEMGADAVIMVRYGTVGVSFTSWGALDGSGRAIAYDT